MPYQNLKGKKILILGSTKHHCEIVRRANSLDMQTYVVDWNAEDNAPAKKIANSHALISLSEIDKIVQYIKENDIQGVITGFNDSYLAYYIQVCEQANLPCYLNIESLSLTLDKELFKRTCKEFGLSTIPDYDEVEILRGKSLLENDFPLLIKPIDNSGSRGIKVCNSINELESCINYAKSFSKSGKILIEKFFNKEDVSVAYVLQDGKAYLSAVCDRYIFHSQNGGSVTGGLIYPSKYTSRFISEVDAKIKSLLEFKNFTNGVLFLQCFVDEKTFYFYEMGYRLSGGRHYVFTNNQNNVSALDMLLNYAITGNMGDEIVKETPFFPEECVMVSVIGKANETIGRINGLKELSEMPNFIECLQLYDCGDTVGTSGTTASIILKISLHLRSSDSLKEVISKIQRTLKIENAKGENIIETFFNNNFFAK